MRFLVIPNGQRAYSRLFLFSRNTALGFLLKPLRSDRRYQGSLLTMGGGNVRFCKFPIETHFPNSSGWPEMPWQNWHPAWKSYANPLPRVCAIFWLSIEYSAKAQPPRHNNNNSSAPPPRCCCCVPRRLSSWLNTQWTTPK